MSNDIIPDLTGTNLNYKKVNETVAMPGNRIFIPDEGLFYAESIKIFDTAANRHLTPNIDFIFLQPDSTLSAKSAKTVCSYIMVKPGVSDELVIEEYQFVGGFYKTYTSIVRTFLPGIVPNNFINYQTIHSPDVFEEDHILRANVSSFGWEFIAWAIDRISQALLVGDEDDHDRIRNQLRSLLELIENALPQAMALLNQHISNMSNPHEVTPAQLNTLTKSAMDAVLTDYLMRGDPSIDTSLFCGANFFAFSQDARSNLCANEVTDGVINPLRLVGGYNPDAGEQVLTNRGWMGINALADADEPIFYHGQTMAELYQTFIDYPIGTKVTLLRKAYENDNWWNGGRYGNGYWYEIFYTRETYRRTTTAPDGWVLMHK